MESVISLITLYHPTKENIQNAQRIAEQSTLTILADNSDVSNQSLVDEIIREENVVYCPNYDNLGLSAAYNKILMNPEIYSWNKDDFIVFFDQDSVIGEGHIRKLTEEYIRIREKGIHIGCIGPVYFDQSQDAVRVPKMYRKINESSMIVDNIITSSMVSTYGNLEEVGFWSEDVFLDMADWDICWKMKKHGLVTILTEKTMLTHKVGEGNRKVGPVTLDIGKPFREYYETRDCVYLLKKDYIPLKDRIRFHLQLTIRPLLHLWFLDDKAERKYYIRLGYSHAKQRRTGKLPKEDLWGRQEAEVDK